jgi:CheY-like chemotaxis protein
VFVVEDDVDTRDMLGRFLELEGYHVELAANGQQALDRLTSGVQPCVILLDLMMPVMSGEAFREEQLLLPNGLDRIPVVVLSAKRSAERSVESMGAAALIPKPFDLDFVVVNEQASSYVQDLQVAIDWLCENARLRGDEHGPREHIFTVRRDLMGAATYQALLAVARVVLHTRNGTIEDQMERAEARRRLERVSERLVPPGQASAGKKADERRRRETDANLSEDLQFWNGFGGFSPDGREYVVRLDGGGHTPHPWVERYRSVLAIVTMA